MDQYYSRIDTIPNNDFNWIAREVCLRYNLGILVKSEVIKTGYEDFNAHIWTSTGQYVVKVFNNKRKGDEKKWLEAEQCIARTNAARQHGLLIPKVHRNTEGELITYVSFNGSSNFCISLIEFIDGLTFYQLQQEPSFDELNIIVGMACSLSQVKYSDLPVYDPWGIQNFEKEFQNKRDRLPSRIVTELEPICLELMNFDFRLLPKSFVHGDITSTNLIKSTINQIWLIDFSVSNYIARMIEIVVICDDLALVVGNRRESEERVIHCFETWCKSVGATKNEKDAFSLLFQVANAVNVMNTTIAFQEGNDSEENMRNMELGNWGLSLF